MNTTDNVQCVSVSAEWKKKLKGIKKYAIYPKNPIELYMPWTVTLYPTNLIYYFLGKIKLLSIHIWQKSTVNALNHIKITAYPYHLGNITDFCSVGAELQKSLWYSANVQVSLRYFPLEQLVKALSWYL